ncbi:MAG: CHASE domain-containing protein [Sulfuricurvum sp.]|nr:CHASE domain-containing protein [Sulfuricurvum sp.]
MIFIVLISVVIASFVWLLSKNYFDNRAQELFEVKVHTNIDHLEKRILTYEHVLRSGVAYFQGSENVTAQEWHQFIQTLEIKKYYPGMQGMGFSLMIRPDEVAMVEQKMRREGFPSFMIKPGGVRDQYSSILYLEPQDKRNLQAIGYDMYCEPIRREAMQRARDTGLPATSGRVKLIQEIDADIQPGILMYLPLYKIGKKIDTIEERRGALIGFIYSPFRMKNLLNTIVLNDSLVNFEVYDGNKKSEGRLLYRSSKPSFYVSQHHAHRTIKIGGRLWSIDLSSTPEFDEAMDSKYPVLLTLGGVFLYFILLTIIVTLIRSREMIQIKTNEVEINREWLNSLLKSATDGIHILDSEGKLVEYSSSFIRSLGYSEEEAQTLTIFDWEGQIPKESLLDMMNSITQYPVTFETRHHRKDGTSFDVEITSREIFLEGKRYLYGSSRDISDRKNVEKALRYEKEAAQNYLDIVDVIIVVVDTNKKVKLINRKGCEIIGYTANEVIGKNWIKNFLPERIQIEINEIANKFIERGDNTDYYENPILTKQGEERLIAWRNTSLFDPNGKFIGILSSGEDITNIRQAEKKLRESEEFYKTIFSSVYEAIFILEKNIIVDCNGMALQLFDMNRGTLIGTNILDTAWNIQCEDMNFNTYLDIAYKGKPIFARCSLVMNNGTDSIKIIEVALSGFGSDASKLILIARDITQKLAEEKIFRIQTRQAQMGEMISMIAHQWRQPLAIINAITSQLQLEEVMKGENNPFVIEKLMKIEQQSIHLSQTISDYRDFFRPDKPKEYVSLSLLVHQALELIDHTLKSHGIKGEEIINNDPNLFTYRNEVLQVLIALLKNSLDAFTEKGIKEGTITISIDQDDEYGIVTICDNAGGIAPDVIARLFTPYFTTKNTNIGTGLGLYMSKTIIEEHCHGSIEVRSKGQEAIFTIKIPREKEVL